MQISYISSGVTTIGAGGAAAPGPTGFMGAQIVFKK